MLDFKQELFVLIVENNPVDIKMLNGMLTGSSYGHFRTTHSASLKEACQILSREKIDVALLDLNLPDSRGMQTLKKLHSRFPALPIVVNTGVYEDDVGLQTVTAGAQDYLIKGKYKSYGLSKSLYYAIERKKAEKALQDAYMRLKETQAQLIQFEKMNVVGGLASGIAHEVKNPLATIMYGVEFLNMKCEGQDGEIGLTLKSIREAAEKANQIIKDLLDFASLSELHTTTEDIHEILEHSLNLVKHQCSKNHIEIIKKFTESLPRINVDKNRVEQVLVDIMLNAIYAMPHGGQLVISTQKAVFKLEHSDRFGFENRFEQGDQLLVVDIDDTGEGIAQRHLPKIYDPFFTTRRASGGVGLGLSMARTIMKNHKGGIYVTNKTEGGGARARLMFRV